MNDTDYIGKVILVGLTFTNAGTGFHEQHQIHGLISRIRTDGFLEISIAAGEVFLLPFEEGSLKKADPGLYREVSTGNEISDPDFITFWTVDDAHPEMVASYLKHGFGRFEKK